jgi:glycerophosphoryl diester phosphodiesterase
MMGTSTVIVYHRGGGKSLGYPPNALLTAQWAMKGGARAVEYDVLVARDRGEYKVVVFEPKLIKEAGLDINNLTWSDVRKIDAGSEKFGAQEVTLLETMLSAIDPEKVAHQIQIKGKHPATVREVLTRVRHASNYIITAFDINVIKEIKTLDKSIRVGWLVKPVQEDSDEAGVDLTAKLVSEADALREYSTDEIAEIVSQAKGIAVDVVLLCGPRIKQEWLVRRVKEAGFQIGAWGVASNRVLASRLMKLRLDRFTLDNPELFER